VNSLPTIEQANDDKFRNVLMVLDPDLYLIKVALEETHVNPRMVPRIIRSVANLAYGTQFGKVQIFMQAGIITQVKGEESDQLNLDAVDKFDNE
jgi:hypothetical protein